MRFCGLGQEFRARQPVLDVFCRAGKNHLPAFPSGQCRVIFSRLGKIICHFPNGQCWMIFAGLGKNHLPTFPMDSARWILQGWEKSITRFPQWTVQGDCCRAGKNHLPLSPIASAGWFLLCWTIFAGLEKNICHILLQPRPIQLSTWNAAQFGVHQLKPWNENRNRIEPRHVE